MPASEIFIEAMAIVLSQREQRETKSTEPVQNGIANAIRAHQKLSQSPSPLVTTAAFRTDAGRWAGARGWPCADEGEGDGLGKAALGLFANSVRAGVAGGAR
jgi:hypothetical protein